MLEIIAKNPGISNTDICKILGRTKACGRDNGGLAALKRKKYVECAKVKNKTAYKITEDGLKYLLTPKSERVICLQVNV